MKYDFITIGGSTEDITFFTQEGVLMDNKDDILRQKLLCFEYGAKINIEKSLTNFGGGANNAAACLSALGFKVACLTAVGCKHIAQNIIDNMKKHGVHTELVQHIKKATSGLSFILVCQNEERIIFSSRGANSYLSITDKILNKIKNTKWIYIASLSGKWKTDLDKIFSLKNINFVWNPGHYQLKNGYSHIKNFLKKTDVLILNKDEALELVVSNHIYLKQTNLFLNNIVNLLKILHSWGPRIVVITNGIEGAKAFDGKNIYEQKIYKPKKIVDKTGVGDAFGSSFVAGLELFKGNIKKALDLGARNSASKITKQGAQNGLLNKKSIKK